MGGLGVSNDWCSSFQQITFNLGNFTNLKELSPVESRLVTHTTNERLRDSENESKLIF